MFMISSKISFLGSNYYSIYSFYSEKYILA